MKVMHAMIDAMVRSALFGVRNVDKVQNGDTGRCAAATFQLFNAGKNALESATKLHNSLGKGAQSAVSAMKTVSNSGKALETAAKVVKFGSENVNVLLCGAAAYRVLTAENKEKAVKKELCGMGTMFGVEHLMREGFKSKAMMNLKNNINNKYAKVGISILEGVLFVIGSIAASTTGYKIGEALYDEEQKLSKEYNFDKIKAEIEAKNKKTNSLQKFADEALKVNDDEFYTNREVLA